GPGVGRNLERQERWTQGSADKPAELAQNDRDPQIEEPDVEPDSAALHRLRAGYRRQAGEAELARMILEGAAAALALAPVAFAGGFIQGLTGFGSALVTIPLATYFVPLPFALAVFAVVDFGNGLGLENPKNAIKGDIARMVPFMILGIVTGTTLLVNLPRQASLIALGTFVLVYAIYSLSRRGAPAIVSRNWAFFAGFSGGLSGT